VITEGGMGLMLVTLYRRQLGRLLLSTQYP
jgi:hypothetical protein